MALSDQEQQLLREIEESLLADDPKFGASVSSASRFQDGPETGRLTIRSLALIVLGLCLLVGGVALATHSLWFVSLSVVGFIVMFAGGVWALRTPADPSPRQADRTQHPSQRGRMSSKMEENFRRRFEGQ